MNAHTVPPPAPDTECTLASLRTVSARLKLIDLRIAEIGLALKRGTITPGRAIALCEDAAPGCLDIISSERISEVLK